MLSQLLWSRSVLIFEWLRANVDSPTWAKDTGPLKERSIGFQVLRLVRCFLKRPQVGKYGINALRIVRTNCWIGVPIVQELRVKDTCELIDWVTEEVSTCHTRVRACVRACMHAGTRLFVCVCACTCVHGCVRMPAAPPQPQAPAAEARAGSRSP